MSFHRHFQDTQIPEWKKAYIDYYGLLAEIEVIRAKIARNAGNFDSFGSFVVPHSIWEKYGDLDGSRKTKTPLGFISPMTSLKDPSHTTGDIPRRIVNKEKRISFIVNLPCLPPPATRAILNISSKQGTLSPETPRSPIIPFFGLGSPMQSSLHTVLSNMPNTIHARFFDMLDAELAKVETFYMSRIVEMHEYAGLLRKQLDEFGIHRQMFYESPTHSKHRRSCSTVISSLTHWFLDHWRSVTPHQSRNRAVLSYKGRDGSLPPEVLPQYPNGLPGPPFRTSYAPGLREYQRAKKQLREAVIEHYRGLEMLNNYRILNLAGFRKALKKYGRIMNVSALDIYTKEKVEPSAFASGIMVMKMLEETEQLFSVKFGHGNKKRALSHLQAESSSKTYHVSVYRSGLWLGLAIPAIAGGTYISFQENARNSLPWESLLYIYSILALPILLALLVGINILVWVRKRINYTLIFELNPSSKLDHREYFELPSLLLCTLAYAFWFSLAQIGPSTLWPLIWLIFASMIMANPCNKFMWGSSRWWTIKSIAKLGISALQGVEFTDVWLADLACSLVYSFSGLFFVGCFYAQFNNVTFPSLMSTSYDLRVQEVWSTCGLSENSGWYCLLGIMPFLLINSGKYGMSMIQFCCYCYWRYQETPHFGRSYIIWCFVSILNSLYGCAWDFLMDWSMLRPHARFPLLRQELVYNSQIPCYYFALLSNACVRFVWVIYIYSDPAHMSRRTFVVAVLEVLRRVQWNFYRLESKHLENMNRYHVRRKMPLPYSFDKEVSMVNETPRTKDLVEIYNTKSEQ